MERDRFEESLKELGVDPKNAEVLALLPLIYVGWADGKMEGIERSRILEIAKSELQLGDAAREQLEQWLFAPPTPAYFRAGLTQLRLLARAPDQPVVGVPDLQRFVIYAESVARATPTNSDSPWSVKPVEAQAIQQIAAALGVDFGQSWARMLTELGETPKRPTSPPLSEPPQVKQVQKAPA